MRSNNKVGRNGWNCGIRAARCPSPSWKESAKSLMEKGPTAPHRVSTRKALYCVCVCTYAQVCTSMYMCAWWCVNKYVYPYRELNRDPTAESCSGPAGNRLLYIQGYFFLTFHSWPMKGQMRGLAALEMHWFCQMGLRLGQRWRRRWWRDAAPGLCWKQEMISHLLGTCLEHDR